MLADIKRLSKESGIYGLSTIAGRFLNFFLLPIYTHCMSQADYGVVATLFSYIVFLNVVFGHGMDFAFMRHFKPKTAAEEAAGFSTAFWSLAATSLLLAGLIHFFAAPLSALGGLPPEAADAVRCAAWILAFDALALIPYAELRMTHRAGVFAAVRFANIALNLALSYVFLIHWRLGLRGVFLANLVASIATLAMLAPVLVLELKPAFDRTLYESLLRFALPIVPAGLASMMVQVIDRPILKFLTDAKTVGLYQANYRLGAVMMLVVGVFDTAWRPFFIEKSAGPAAQQVLARVLTYFVAASCFVCLGLALFIAPVIALPVAGGKPLIPQSYWSGLPIVPVVALGYLFNGVYVNMLAPVTIAKRTDLVAYTTAIGALVNVAALFLWIPRWGIMGAAAATLAAYMAMAAVLFILGRKVYPIGYEYRRLAHAGLCLAAVGGLARLLGVGVAADRLLLRALLCAAYPALLAATGFFNAGERRALRGWLEERAAGSLG